MVSVPLRFVVVEPSFQHQKMDPAAEEPQDALDRSTAIADSNWLLVLDVPSSVLSFYQSSNATDHRCIRSANQRRTVTFDGERIWISGQLL